MSDTLRKYPVYFARGERLVQLAGWVRGDTPADAARNAPAILGRGGLRRDEHFEAREKAQVMVQGRHVADLWEV